MRTLPKSLTKITISLAAFFSAEAFADQVRTFPAAGLKEITVDNGQGKVTIVGEADGGQVLVRLGTFESPEACEVKSELNGTQLVIVARAKDKLFGNEKCKIDITVTSPRSTPFNLRIGSGSLVVKNMRGPIDFNIGSGDSKFSAVEIPEMIGRSGSGDVKIDGTIDRADLKVGAGNVNLALNKIPREGALDVKVGSGSTTIMLPGHAKITSNFRSGRGSLTNEFPNTDGAKFKISGSSGTGDMIIKKF